MTCEARQYSDQKHCPRCKLTWDMNDPEPPQCGKDVHTGGESSSEQTLSRIRRHIDTGEIKPIVHIITADVPNNLSEHKAMSAKAILDKINSTSSGGNNT